MKEAASELSLTAIAVVAIAAIGLVFTTLVWPNIKASIQRNTNCNQAISCDNCNGKTCTCIYLDENDSQKTVTCPQK